MRRALALCCLMLATAAPAAPAAEQEAAVGRFLGEVFPGGSPTAGEIVLIGDLRPAVRSILGHDYPRIRVAYWHRGSRSAWVLDEIGKEMPITVGIAVDGEAIERVRVLVYRESRGGEVRLPAFTRQFDGAHLVDSTALDRPIDGIAGATLSVRALQRLSRMALYLHRRVNKRP